MNQFKQKLIGLGASSEMLRWVGTSTIEQAWAKCERLEWLSWVAGELDLPKPTLAKIRRRAYRIVLRMASLAVGSRSSTSIGDYVKDVSDYAKAKVEEVPADRAHAVRAAAYVTYVCWDTRSELDWCDKFRQFYPVELVKRGLGL